jgi:hypothetical protein
MRNFLPTPIADRLRQLERARAKDADRQFKRTARGPLPGETTNRVLPRGNR